MHFCSSGKKPGTAWDARHSSPKLININIDSIEAECKTSIEKELHVMEKGCANADADLRTEQGANGQNSQNNANKTINYLFSSCNVDVD